MHARLFLALAILVLASGCYSTPPGGPDGEGPRIRLTSMSGAGRPFYDTAVAPGPADNRCFRAHGFPEQAARMAVTLNDPGGLKTVEISILVGKIVVGSLVAAPDWTVASVLDRATERTTVTFVPAGTDRVLTGALVVFEVTSTGGGVAMEVVAEDMSGNRNTLEQVDIRPTGDPVPCRGES